MKQAEDKYFDYFFDKGTPKEFQIKLIEAGYSDRESIQRRNDLLRPSIVRSIVEEQTYQFRINIDRLKQLASLQGKSAKELAGTTVVSIGGGPGDLYGEPWFPRAASIAGAKVINFDISPADLIDNEYRLYTHIGGWEGNVFNLLLNDISLLKVLRDQGNISIIETNGLIGTNISPTLAIDLGDLSNRGNPFSNSKIIEMRKNLRDVAGEVLMEGGVLAIDEAYWCKNDGKLIAVDEKGYLRKEPVFPEEEIK
jgi:hypothetical protein